MGMKRWRGRATGSVGGVGVDAARRTGRGGDRGGVGGVLPAVSLQTVIEREGILHEKGVLELNDSASNEISFLSFQTHFQTITSVGLLLYSNEFLFGDFQIKYQHVEDKTSLNMSREHTVQIS